MKSAQRCYPAGNNRVFELIGYVLLIVGIILLFVSLPGWVWIALLGIALMVVGYILLRISHSWR